MHAVRQARTVTARPPRRPRDRRPRVRDDLRLRRPVRDRRLRRDHVPERHLRPPRRRHHAAGNLCGLAIEACRRGLLDLGPRLGRRRGRGRLPQMMPTARAIGDLFADGILQGREGARPRGCRRARQGHGAGRLRPAQAEGHGPDLRDGGPRGVPSAHHLLQGRARRTSSTRARRRQGGHAGGVGRPAVRDGHADLLPLLPRPRAAALPHRGRQAAIGTDYTEGRTCTPWAAAAHTITDIAPLQRAARASRAASRSGCRAGSPGGRARTSVQL